MPETINEAAIVEALVRASEGLQAQSEYLTSLDQATGDGDMGITMARIGAALIEYARATPTQDLGKFLGGAGLAANRAGSSTMGTLLATALMRAGKEAAGKAGLAPADLAVMFQAAERGIQERGKANLGDKTVLDALHPAVEAFSAAIGEGQGVHEAGMAALRAAESARDAVTPLRARIGRGAWIGERTEGCVDPGCAALVVILQALAG